MCLVCKIDPFQGCTVRFDLSGLLCVFYGLYSFCVSFGMLNALSPTENRSEVLSLSVIFNFIAAFLLDSACILFRKWITSLNEDRVIKCINFCLSNSMAWEKTGCFQVIFFTRRVKIWNRFSSRSFLPESTPLSLPSVLSDMIKKKTCVGLHTRRYLSMKITLKLKFSIAAKGE